MCVPPDRATLEAELSQARAALNALIMGNKPRVIVDQNGERVEFSGANLDALRRWIRELEAGLGCGVPVISRGPMGFTF